MATYSSLPPELQEVETELQHTFKKGDLEACKALVTRLAAEADFAQVVADEADLAILELEEDSDTFPEIHEATNKQRQRLMQVKLEAEKVLARHAYAVVRLQSIGK